MRKQRKHEVIAEALRNGSLNRFEAERLGDHCLNSTVSDLRKRGENVLSMREKVRNRFGGETSVNRYWIASDKRQQPESNS